LKAVNITDEEVDTLMDENLEIRYEKVFEWCLPVYGDNDNQTLLKYQAARMRNYIRKQIVEEGWTLKYYCASDRSITADNVARFYGACLDK
jgi:hypothetical protein